MTVNDPRPGTNPPAAITLTGDQRRYVEQARALADAGDAGREALAELLGHPDTPVRLRVRRGAV